LPLSVSAHAANHLQLCFDFYMIEAKPENLIGDCRPLCDGEGSRGKPDEWLPPSEAQYKLLTANKPDFVNLRRARGVGRACKTIRAERRSSVEWDAGARPHHRVWIIKDALVRPNADVTLLALWNGKAGDGPGGRQDMVKRAEAHGAQICAKNTDELFGVSR